MSASGEMPRRGSERALSDRWLEERAALMVDGPSRTFVARCWVHALRQPRSSPLLPRGVAPAAVVAAPELFAPYGLYVEVALYPASAARGSLPVALVPFPVEVGVAVRGHGELVVRGEPGPGRGVVAVLPDGTPVGCAGPALPPPVFRRGRVRLR